MYVKSLWFFLVLTTANSHAQDLAELFKQANRLFKQKQFKSARTCYQQVLERNPTILSAIFNLGVTCAQLHDYPQAIRQFRNALEHQSNNQLFWQHLGHAYAKQGDYHQAVDAYEQCVSLKPNAFAIRTILADLLNQINCFERALDHYHVLYASSTHNADVCYFMARTLRMLKRYDEALIFFNKALEYNPDHEQANLGRARLYLQLGDFKRGWPAHECFLKDSTSFDHSPLTQHDLHNQTWLLRAAGGFGDTFQFIRYAQQLKQYGATIIACVHPNVKKIISLCPYIDSVTCVGDYIPHHDRYCAITSLPYVLQTSPETITNTIPYLHAEQKLINAWQQKIKDDTNFTIGICWQPSKQNDHTQRLPAEYRNIPLNMLASIGTLPGISLYSLQKRDGIEELRNVPSHITVHTFDDFDDSHGAFMDTAALIHNLDLVISTDTSVAHLAGGLGVPVWVLLPYHADWRWLLDRDDSPWYPTMRLFRQAKSEGWQSVITAVMHALEKRNVHEKNNYHHMHTQY